MRGVRCEGVGGGGEELECKRKREVWRGDCRGGVVGRGGSERLWGGVAEGEGVVAGDGESVVQGDRESVVQGDRKSVVRLWWMCFLRPDVRHQGVHMSKQHSCDVGQDEGGCCPHHQGHWQDTQTLLEPPHGLLTGTCVYVYVCE